MPEHYAKTTGPNDDSHCIHQITGLKNQFNSSASHFGRFDNIFLFASSNAMMVEMPARISLIVSTAVSNCNEKSRRSRRRKRKRIRRRKRRRRGSVMIEENIGARKRNAQALSKGISDVKSMHIVHTTVKLSTRNVEVQLSLVFSDFAV